MTELGSLLAALKARMAHLPTCPGCRECEPGFYKDGQIVWSECTCDREARLDAAIVRGIEAALSAYGNETAVQIQKQMPERAIGWFIPKGTRDAAALAALRKEWDPRGFAVWLDAQAVDRLPAGPPDVVTMAEDFLADENIWPLGVSSRAARPVRAFAVWLRGELEAGALPAGGEGGPGEELPSASEWTCGCGARVNIQGQGAHHPGCKWTT